MEKSTRGDEDEGDEMTLLLVYSRDDSENVSEGDREKVEGDQQ